MDFSNVYEDAKRADAYSKLEFPGTYYLAFRDLPAIISEHVNGKDALDFGCGSGRSARFLKRLGFRTIGIDIADEMVKRARMKDPKGDYRVMREGDFSQFEPTSFDLILSAFPFDNIPTLNKKVANLKGLGGLLREDGILVNLVSSPEIYWHEWVSFSTKDFPENRLAKSGDRVWIVQKNIGDERPVEDVLWTDDAYQKTYRRAQVGIVSVYRPLARTDEPFSWVNETMIPPWVIYVLKRIR